jgi:hypothetical protein
MLTYIHTYIHTQAYINAQTKRNEKQSSMYLCVVPVHSLKTCRESVGMAPFIVNLGTRWRLVINVTPRPPYPPGKDPDVH